MSPFAIIVIVFVAAVGLYVGYKNLYTKKNGIETEATVTRIEEETQADSDGISTTYMYYVRYTTAEGQSQDAQITNPGFKRLKVGDQIKIKYLPEKPNAVVWIKERANRNRDLQK